MAITKAEFRVQHRFAPMRERCRISDWRLVFGAAVAQVVTAVAVSMMSIDAVIKVAGRGRPMVRWLLRGPETRVVWAITATSRHLGSFSTCLVRALVAELALSSPPRPLEIRIGVRRHGRALDGHAWLVDGERVLLGGPVSDQFVVTAALGPAGVRRPSDSHDHGRAHHQ
jgi:Transglutaminase-like superfamily